MTIDLGGEGGEERLRVLMVRRGIDIGEGEFCVGHGGGEHSGEEMEETSGGEECESVRVPSSEDAAARAIGREEGKLSVVGGKERGGFETINIREFGFLQAGDRGYAGNKVVFDGSAFSRIAQPADVPGDEVDGCCFVIHKKR